MDISELMKSFDASLPAIIDPWGVVCERCPLPDCVRPEGGLSPAVIKDCWTKDKRAALERCPVQQAQTRRLTPLETLWKAEEFGLLEEA